MAYFEQFTGTPSAEQEAAMARMQEATPDPGVPDAGRRTGR